MLSAVLLNCAMLVVVRYYIIVNKAIGAEFPQMLMLIFGLLSVAVAALFIIVQRDIKRLLAYSSVENMGLIALAFGIGGPLGTLAALLHTVNHSTGENPAVLLLGQRPAEIRHAGHGRCERHYARSARHCGAVRRRRAGARRYAAV